MTQATKTPDDIIGVSEHIKKVRRRIKEAAARDVTVLIQGDTGTGKELIAKAIHYSSQRSKNRLVEVDCGAIPPDLFESEFFGHGKGAFTGAVKPKKGLVAVANGGTLFLDEVGNLSLVNQKKLLHFLQERTFRQLGGDTTQSTDVRIIAATNKNLNQAVQDPERTFEKDLYHRLRVFPIYTEPLANRPEDVVCLVNHVMADKKLSVDPEVKFVLYSYDFPGNVRDIENMLPNSYSVVREEILRESEHREETDANRLVEMLSWIDDTAVKSGTEFEKLIVEIVQCYEIVTLWQQGKLSKTKIAEPLRYRKKEALRMFNEFKQTFGFDLPPRDDPRPLSVYPKRIYREFLNYMGRKSGQSKAEEMRLLSVLRKLHASKNHNSTQ
jgi:transcriptional regulator with PAS, ATPase and Fis domain